MAETVVQAPETIDLDQPEVDVADLDYLQDRMFAARNLEPSQQIAHWAFALNTFAKAQEDPHHPLNQDLMRLARALMSLNIDGFSEHLRNVLKQANALEAQTTGQHNLDAKFLKTILSDGIAPLRQVLQTATPIQIDTRAIDAFAWLEEEGVAMSQIKSRDEWLIASGVVLTDLGQCLPVGPLAKECTKLGVQVLSELEPNRALSRIDKVRTALDEVDNLLPRDARLLNGLLDDLEQALPEPETQRFWSGTIDPHFIWHSCSKEFTNWLVHLDEVTLENFYKLCNSEVANSGLLGYMVENNMKLRKKVGAVLRKRGKDPQVIAQAMREAVEDATDNSAAA